MVVETPDRLSRLPQQSFVKKYQGKQIRNRLTGTPNKYLKKKRSAFLHRRTSWIFKKKVVEGCLLNSSDDDANATLQ